MGATEGRKKNALGWEERRYSKQHGFFSGVVRGSRAVLGFLWTLELIRQRRTNGALLNG